MTPTLREAAKAVLQYGNTEAGETVPFSVLLAVLAEALKTEPEAPKVMRVCVGTSHNGGGTLGMMSNGDWTYYAERTIPAKTKREELADRLERGLNAYRPDPAGAPCVHYVSCHDIREAVAELRKKEPEP